MRDIRGVKSKLWRGKVVYSTLYKMDDDYAYDDLDTLTALLDDDGDDCPPGFRYDDEDTSVTNTPSTYTPKSSQSNSMNSQFRGSNSSINGTQNHDDIGDKSKEDLMEELRKMQERMKQLEDQVKQKENKPREMFSDAICSTPTTENKKTNKKEGTSKSLTDGKKRARTSTSSDEHNVASSSASSSPGEKTRYTSSSPGEKTSPTQSLFGKNKKRAAHTPKSKPKVETDEDQKKTSSSPFRCSLCDMKFTTVDTYASHQYMHQKNHPWKCDSCTLTFTSEQSLATHIRTHKTKVTTEQKRTPKLSTESVSSSSSTLFAKKSMDSTHTNGQFKSNKTNQFTASTTQRKDLAKKEDEGKWTTEVYSQIRIINPKVSSEMMKARMEGRKMIRMSVIKKHMIGGKIEGDWVTIGVLVNKIPPKTSSNGKPYSIWKLNDLHNLEITVSLFLFGDVHKQHWKTLTGSVIGLLNPEIMSKKDGEEEIAIKVDHPQKIMMMGDSKDLGYCRGKRKDGKSCSMFVNKAECEFCQFHVQAAYKKMSAKRTDLQASYAGPQPKVFKQKLINSGTIFYGGQSYTTQTSSSKQGKPTKEKNTLKNLNLAKAKELQQADRVNMMKINKLSTNDAAEFLSIANGNESFQDRLVTPTVGSQNLLRHMKKVEQEEKVQKGLIETISASDLLKQHKKNMSEQRAQKRKLSAASTVTSSNLSNGAISNQSSGPMLGRGLGQGKDFFLEFSPPSSKGKTSNNRAMERARALLKTKGPFKKSDPNSVEKSRVLTAEKQAAVRKRVEQDVGESYEADSSEEQPRKKRKFLGADLSEIDTNSEEFKKIMKAKSKHDDLIHEVEADLQEKYFNELEKKEKLESKMASIMEKVCKVVTCQQCKYTYFSPAARCRTEKHDLKWHEAKQRFFNCKNCRTKTFSFNKIPTSHCRNCGSDKFERTGMLNERKGPKLGGETLLLRGEEEKFI